MNGICLLVFEQLLERQRRKGFLHRIVSGFITIKRRKSWGVLGHASTSTAKPNIQGHALYLVGPAWRSVL